jgi:carboxylate-amine ligase
MSGIGPHINFQPCTQPSIGVELELQVLDRDTGDLAPGALRILQECDAAGLDGVSGEFLLSMLEVRSDVCANVAGLRDNILPRLRQVRNIASSLGYDLALSGTHPFARPTMAAIAPGERYQRIQRHHGWLAYQEAVFGLHIHVGVPNGDAAIGVINHVVEYLPHLLSLSANSPFWQGVDTSYASARLRMFRPSASCGIPQPFDDWREFCDYCAAMSGAGALESIKDLYWDIRPQPDFGTVEFRIFDAPSSLSAVLGLTALTRSLVVSALQSMQGRGITYGADKQVFWLANENRWLATRYGLDAGCMRRRGAERRTLRDDCSHLIDQLTPVSRSLGDDHFLKQLRTSRPLACGADKQRQIYRQHGQWQAVVDHLKTAWVSEVQGFSDSHIDDSPNGGNSPATSWSAAAPDALSA